MILPAAPAPPAGQAPALPGPGARRRGRRPLNAPLVVEVHAPAQVDPAARRRFLEALADVIVDRAFQICLDNPESTG